ncbi:transposable element Tcb2 transposase [Trichonephila clavipes]|nr:transposable element Tcb2 transposase [Trichonephila clavipes]
MYGIYRILIVLLIPLSVEAELDLGSINCTATASECPSNNTCSGTIPQTSSGRRMVTSARDDRHLFRMALNDRTASSRQLAAHWSTATGVLMSASSIRRRLLHRELRARVPL